MAFSPKTTPPADVTTRVPGRAARAPKLMREDVLLRPAFKIKQGASRQEIEAAARQIGALFARQHSVESRAQRVQMQDVSSGVALLLLGQGWCAPIRALLLFFKLDAEQILAQIAQPVPVAEGTHQPRGGLGAIKRLRHHPEIVVEDREIEPREMEQLDDCGVDEEPLQIRGVVAAGGELNEMSIAIAARELYQAQPVAMRVEPHRLGVDRDRVTE